ncbi:Lipase secreted [Phytophthora megakarya]|uniref:Lipase secreted n=1 Tax=Phytophthora megakarya TaxID=4795 RepID=A0A225WT17_9STRA|nr:Lipase secreted [Phytophthora megakarya]
MRSSLIFALALPTVWAEQAANFDVTQATADAYECGQECYKALQSTIEYDRVYVGIDFDADFYATAANFSTSKAGDLLKFKPLDPANLTTISGISSYRIQYVSEDYNGTLIPVTGFIALPNTLPADGKFPLVAFAHGTIGTNYGCAISNGPDFADYNMWSLISERGYAIVATDYAGLGNNATTHRYCTFPAHAKDLFHSVVAARQAFGSVLTREWLSVGHSQGGAAVWKLAEDIDSLAEAHNSSEADNFIGTVALAPASRVSDLFKFAVENVLPRDDYYTWATTDLLLFAPYAVQQLYPEFSSTILGDKALKRLGLAKDAQLCANGVMGLALDFEIHMVVYPKQDHTGIVTAAAPEWLRWVDQRFDATHREVLATSECTKVTLHPFHYEYVRSKPEIDLNTFLLN